MSWSNPEALRQMGMLEGNLSAHGMDPAGALAQMAGRLHGQASVMSFIDIFLLIAVVFSGLALVALLMKKPPEGTSVEAH